MENTDKTISLGMRNYESLNNILQAYRRAGGKRDTIAREFNRFDNPGTLYFRIFFDFQNGLLDCVHDLGSMPVALNRDYFWDPAAHIADSALNYLTINNEWERADMLRQFIKLLSNINSRSPWYFSTIDGLGEVLDRTEFNDTYAIPEEKVITIKCLPDAQDQRIGTLIDLYRAICYSYQLHKEIVPANLRRFDMYIYIFSKPIRDVHLTHNYEQDLLSDRSKPQDYTAATYDQRGLNVEGDGNTLINSLNYLTSSKLILLESCEFDLNASKTGYESISNEEGFTPSYSIPIKVRTAIEQRYNEFILRRIGDLVLHDMDLDGENDEFPGFNKYSSIDIDAETADMNLTAKTLDGEHAPNRWGEGRTSTSNPSDVSNLGNSSGDMGSTGDTSLNQKMYVDQNKPDKEDNWNNLVVNNNDPNGITKPWKDMASDKLDKLAGQANQIVDAGKSVFNSWTNLNELSNNLAGSVGSLVDRLMFGNIFETTLQDISTGISSELASFSSGHVLDSAMRSKGWSHKDRKNGSITPFSSNPNLRQSVSPSVPTEVEGNIFGR
jgi:hypothetical protein